MTNSTGAVTSAAVLDRVDDVRVRGVRTDWQPLPLPLDESLEGHFRTLLGTVRGMTEKARKGLLVAQAREHLPEFRAARSIARCGTVVRRGAPSDEQAVQRATCGAQGCPQCGGFTSQRRAAETLNRVPKNSTVVLMTFTTRDRREATIAQRWAEQDSLWKTAFTNSKFLQRHGGLDAGWRRFPDVTFRLNPWAMTEGNNSYVPHPHHHVAIVLPHHDGPAAWDFARNMTSTYFAAARRLGVDVGNAGQDYLVAASPTKAIRYAGKAIGFTVGKSDHTEHPSATLAELGVIAAQTGDQDALDRYLEAMTHRPRLMPPGGVLRAHRSSNR